MKGRWPLSWRERRNLHAEEARYAIGGDYHKAYSQLTMVDARGRIVRAGKIENTAEAVREFVGV